MVAKVSNQGTSVGYCALFLLTDFVQARRLGLAYARRSCSLLSESFARCFARPAIVHYAKPPAYLLAPTQMALFIIDPYFGWDINYDKRARSRLPVLPPAIAQLITAPLDAQPHLEMDPTRAAQFPCRAQRIHGAADARPPARAPCLRGVSRAPHARLVQFWVGTFYALIAILLALVGALGWLSKEEELGLAWPNVAALLSGLLHLLVIPFHVSCLLILLVSVDCKWRASPADQVASSALPPLSALPFPASPVPCFGPSHLPQLVLGAISAPLLAAFMHCLASASSRYSPLSLDRLACADAGVVLRRTNAKSIACFASVARPHPKP